ncbi:MAG: hypothetical protein ACK5QT_00555 [Oligoflexia bacterium]
MVVRSGTVVLLLAAQPGKPPRVLESLSDEREVAFVEAVLQEGHPDPVWALRHRRTTQAREEEDLADYIEGLVSEPHCKIEILEHASQWFQSRLQLERFQNAESRARDIIVEYALKIYQEDPSRVDFVLSAPTAEVRVRIHLVEFTALSEAS